MSETFVNSDTAFDDGTLKIEGYNIARSDHPSNSEWGGVCVYYNQSLGLKILNIKYLQECVVFQVLITNKLCNLISLYRLYIYIYKHDKTSYEGAKIDAIWNLSPVLIWYLRTIKTW